MRGAVPIILATFPVLSGVPGAQDLFDLVFFVVLVSALLTGGTVPWVMRRLDLVSDEPPAPSAVLEIVSTKKLSGEVVNIACGERISLNTLLAEIGKIAGVELKADYHPTRQGDVRDSLASIDAARALLGYEPKVRVAEGLARTFAAFKAMY